MLDEILHWLPKPLIGTMIEIRRRLNLSPMQIVFKELKKRNIDVKHLHTLEVFGGYGDLHTADYASQVATLDVWEFEPKCEKSLRENLPMAEVSIADSYKEVKNTPKRYDLIVIDNPASVYGTHCEHFDIFPDIFRIAMDSTVIIMNVLPEIGTAASRYYPPFSEVQLAHRKSFYRTNHPEKVSFDEMIKRYEDLCLENGFSLEWHFVQKRSRTFVYYLVIKIVRSRR
jgi:hypothetical protein